MARLSSLWQRSTDRVHRNDEFWTGKKRGFVGASLASMLILNLLFLGDLTYLYGVVFKAGQRVHHFKVLMVDYDGGVVGQSVDGAYRQLRGNAFPTLVQRHVSEFPTEADVRAAVCKGHFWGAIYTHADASARLLAALAGGAAATSYDPADTITYVWNAVRYPSFSQGYVQSNLEQLAAAAGSAFAASKGTHAAQALNVTDAAAVRALLEPMRGVGAPIQPTEQGTRVFYNTVGLIMPMLINFFFVMAINGISTQMQLLARLPRFDNWVIRTALSLVFASTAALVVMGYTWAFRESWAVTGSDFALSWAAMWLFMHVNYYVYDFLTAFIPMAFIALFVFTWIIINVGSAVAPFELTPGFYRWGYALPAKELYDTLTEIWGQGCADSSYRTLPILFSWWLAGTVVSTFSTRRRCDDALASAEAERAKWEKILLNNSDDEKQPVRAADLEKGEELSRTPSTVV